MNYTRKIITATGLISALSLTSCGINPFDLSLLTNNAFANIMVAFLRNLGVPVGMDKRQEGDDPTQQLARMSARSLSKVSAGQQFDTLTVAEAEEYLIAWFGQEFVDANRQKLLQDGDSILFAATENDTDNYEVKNGNVLVNLGQRPVSFLNADNFRFWAFKGHNKKIQKLENGVLKGDKVGEEADVCGLVFIPSTDRRIKWEGVVTRAMDGIGEDHREYNVGDSGSAMIEPLEQEGDDWVQYGRMNYWDESEQKETMGIEIKIYHGGTIGLDERFWSDNKADTHFPLTDETRPDGNTETYYIVATHYGENHPEANAPYEYREEGKVYRSRSCADAGNSDCTLRDGYNYSGVHLFYQKPRGNGEGTVTFYDEDGNEIDKQIVEQDQNQSGDSQVN
ncbi:hypothetical protein ACFL5V_07890 [Fibrobacterota bacterium]